MDKLILLEGYIGRYILSHKRKALFGLFVLWLLSKKFYMRCVARLRRRYPFYSSSYLKSKTAQYLQSRKTKVLQFYEQNVLLVSQEEIDAVLNTQTIRELIAKITNNELSCETIVRVYALRTAELSFTMGHVSDIDLEAALQEAKQKDAIKSEVLSSNNGVLPYLYGIPIALKDHITAKHLLSTMSLQSRLADQLDGKVLQTPSDYQSVWRNTDRKDSSNISSGIQGSKYGYDDAELVRVLREQGAIIICMTNTPVFCGHYITDNAVFGFSENPYNRGRTTGGSSGGSGGIVATRSVPLAIGSDLLGSTRMPSGWCGLYGFNPTSRRISKSGAQGFELRYDCDGAKSILPIFGPMGRNVDDLIDCMRGLFGKFTRDKQCVPMPFNEDVLANPTKISGQPLRFGVVKHDARLGYGHFNINLLEETCAKLKTSGYEVVEFELTEEMWRIEQISKKLFLGNQEKTMMLNELRGETSILSVELSVIGNELPGVFQKLGKMLLHAIGETIAAETLDCLEETSGTQYENLIREREILRKKFYDTWQKAEIDVLILPISHVWAPRRHEQAFVASRFHGALTNSLELPCGTFPVRLAQDKDQGLDFNMKDENRILKTLINKNLLGIQGMPIGLQVAALPFEDEKCLAALKIIEGIHQFHPAAC